MSTATRREFVVQTAVTATGLSIAGAETVRAEEYTAADHLDAQPEHVTIQFERDTLERFQPLLVYDHLKYRPNAMYGWVARSTQRDSAIAVYWADYDKQEGLTIEDSHLGDHEPVYVEFDETTGEILTVIYSAYHWLAGKSSGLLVPMYEETHPQFHVVRPWHQLRQTEQEGAFTELKDFTKPIHYSGRSYDSVFEKWLVADQLSESLQPGSVTNPWMMHDWDHWWRSLSESVGFAPGAWRAKLYYRLSSIPFVDRGGAGESDEVEL